MAESDNQPRRDLVFYFFVLFCTIVIFAYVLWYFVLPFLWGYEKLEISPYSSYYWVANSRGEVKQLVIVFKKWHSGPNYGGDLDYGVPVDPADWRGYFGKTILSEYTRTVYVAPKNSTFEKGQDCNLTVVTSRKNQFSFLISADEASIKNENLTITSVDFYHWPPPHFENPRIQFEVKNLGGTEVIIKVVTVNGISCELSESPWLQKNPVGRILLHMTFPWEDGETYYVEIETIVGNTYCLSATAEED